MRINNNLMAMNTHRQLGIANAAGTKSMEKLSSGFRINRAGDDAAGLSISEKMRNQIRGLGRASSNAQDGISLIQTAEGALDETHSILKRMRELTIQAGNEGTLQDDDLAAIKDEFEELATELDGIADRTEFNGKKLLDGNYKGVLQIGANQGQQSDLNIGLKNHEGKNELLDGEIIVSSGGNLSGKITVDGTDGDPNKILDIIAKDGSGVSEVKFSDSADTGLADGVLTIKLEDAGTIDSLDLEQEIEIDGKNVKLGDLIDIKGDKTLTGAELDEGKTGELKAPENTSINSENLGVKVSDKTKENSSLEEMAKDGINFNFKGLEAGDVKKLTDANLERLDLANRAVSEVRSHLGANQNRLEHTIRNLDNAAENIQAAESRIRDVDMAKEMMEHTKNNILQQASTAMLAQANMAPQNVLQLLG